MSRVTTSIMHMLDRLDAGRNRVSEELERRRTEQAETDEALEYIMRTGTWILEHSRNLESSPDYDDLEEWPEMDDLLEAIAGALRNAPRRCRQSAPGLAAECDATVTRIESVDDDNEGDDHREEQMVEPRREGRPLLIRTRRVVNHDRRPPFDRPPR